MRSLHPKPPTSCEVPQDVHVASGHEASEIHSDKVRPPTSNSRITGICTDPKRITAVPCRKDFEFCILNVCKTQVGSRKRDLRANPKPETLQALDP